MTWNGVWWLWRKREQKGSCSLTEKSNLLRAGLTDICTLRFGFLNSLPNILMAICVNPSEVNLSVKLETCCVTWHQRDPAGLGCSAPRVWAEGKKTPATHRPRETPGSRRERGVWSGNWQPHRGSWINICNDIKGEEWAVKLLQNEGFIILLLIQI